MANNRNLQFYDFEKNAHERFLFCDSLFSLHISVGFFHSFRYDIIVCAYLYIQRRSVLISNI